MHSRTPADPRTGHRAPPTREGRPPSPSSVIDSATEAPRRELEPPLPAALASLAELLRATGGGDVQLGEATAHLAPLPSRPHWSGSWTWPDGEVFFRLHRTALGWLAECSRLGRLEIDLDSGRVTVWRHPECTEAELADYLATAWLALVCELRDGLTLHGSAVLLEGFLVALVGAAGAGKSTLAAALVAGGARLVADDVCALVPAGGGWTAVPTLPLLKLDPRGSAVLHSFPGRLPSPVRGEHKAWIPAGHAVRPGADGRTSLAAVVVLQRGNRPSPGAVTIAPRQLAGRAAWLELLRCSYLASLLAPLGLEERRHRRLAQLADSVPIHRLRYASGGEGLERACEAVRRLALRD